MIPHHNNVLRMSVSAKTDTHKQFVDTKKQDTYALYVFLKMRPRLLQQSTLPIAKMQDHSQNGSVEYREMYKTQNSNSTSQPKTLKVNLTVQQKTRGCSQKWFS